MSQTGASSLYKDPRNRFDYIKEIDRGASSTVYHGFDKDEQKDVAIKIINIEHQDPQTIHNEIQILSRNTCPQVTSYYFSFVVSSELWIIMEFLSCGSLFRLLKKCKTVPEKFIPYILKQLLLALKYLHQEKQIHRDVKCSNLFVHHDGTVKLGDFGVTGQLGHTSDKKNTIIGTSYWMAPEVITQSSYDQFADIWSLGITAIELALGKPPHLDGSIKPLQVIFIIPKSPPPTLEGDFSDSMKDFVRLCLNKDPQKRSTAAELLEHEFVANAELTQEWVDFVNFYMKEDSQKKNEDEDGVDAAVTGIPSTSVKGTGSGSSSPVMSPSASSGGAADNRTEFTSGATTFGQTKTFYGQSSSYNMNSLQENDETEWNFTTKFVTSSETGSVETNGTGVSSVDNVSSEDGSGGSGDLGGHEHSSLHLSPNNSTEDLDVLNSVSDDDSASIQANGSLKGEEILSLSGRVFEAGSSDCVSALTTPRVMDMTWMMARNKELEKENLLLRNTNKSFQSVLRGLLVGEEATAVLDRIGYPSSSASGGVLSPLPGSISRSSSDLESVLPASLTLEASASTEQLLKDLEDLNAGSGQSGLFHSVLHPSLKELLVRAKNGHYDGVLPRERLNNVLSSLLLSMSSVDGAHSIGGNNGQKNFSTGCPNTVMVDLLSLLTSFTLKDAEV